MLTKEKLANELEGAFAENEWIFEDNKALLRFFEQQFQVKYDEATLYRWMKAGKVPAFNHRPPVIPLEGERNLMNVILRYDQLGFPMTYRRIVDMAARMISDETKKAAFKDGVPGKFWFKGFLTRMKKENPNIELVSQRGTSLLTLKSINTDMIDWWFDRVKPLLIKYGFATLPEKDARGEEELVWKTPGRVVIYDETCVSGANTRMGKNKTAKVVTVSGNVDEDSKKRKTANAKVSSEHITMCAGHTLLGHRFIPGFVVSQKNPLKPKQIKEIEKAIYTSVEFGKQIKEIEKPIAASVAEVNLTDVEELLTPKRKSHAIFKQVVSQIPRLGRARTLYREGTSPELNKISHEIDNRIYNCRNWMRARVEEKRKRILAQYKRNKEGISHNLKVTVESLKRQIEMIQKKIQDIEYEAETDLRRLSQEYDLYENRLKDECLTGDCLMDSFANALKSQTTSSSKRKMASILYEKTEDFLMGVKKLQEQEADTINSLELVPVPGFSPARLFGLDELKEVAEKSNIAPTTKRRKTAPGSLTAFGLIHASGTVEMTSLHYRNAIQSANNVWQQKIDDKAQRASNKATERQEKYAEVTLFIIQNLAVKAKIAANKYRAFLKGEIERLEKKGLKTNIEAAERLKRILTRKQGDFLKGAEQYCRIALKTKINRHIDSAVQQVEIVDRAQTNLVDLVGSEQQRCDPGLLCTP